MPNLRKPFYGWIIVCVSFLVGFTESGVFQNILSIFMKPMVEEFGWSRASITGAIAFGSICGGLLSLAVGPVLDRYGPRMVTFWSVLILSAGLIAMTVVDHLWQLYLFFGVGRMIAVGVLSLATSVSVANWFVRRRGRAMGITRIGERLGSALLPVMVQFLILSLGWRMAWGTLGGVVFLMSGIPALLFLRHRPEDMGLLPDGASPAPEKGRSVDSAGKGSRADSFNGDPEPAWDRTQATRTRAFRMLIILSSLIPFAQAGLNFHIFPYLTDQGFNEMTAVLILSTFAFSGMAGSAIWGTLSDRVRIQTLLAANLAGNGVIYLALYWLVQFRPEGAPGVSILFALAALQGIFHGGRGPMLTTLWANFFGRRSLGTIYSLANPFYFTTNAIGPIFGGFFFDLLGSYAFPFHLFIAVYFLSGIVSLRLQPPIHPSAAD
ncbi:MAG: MFS transporter [Deltaproteobacteria bacterium]|nr:MFS transporter [Deltaproteobacteria bacterium]